MPAAEGPRTDMVLDPEHFTQYAAYDLLQAAAHGRVGIDRRWLHAIVDQPEKTLPDIVRFAAEDRSEDRVSIEQDLVSIFQYLRAPEGIPFFRELIRANPDDIIDEVVEALVQIGAPAVTPLLELYDQLDKDKSSEVAFLLAGMGVKDPRVLDLLLKRLEFDRNDALFHLEVYHDAAAIPALQERAAAETDDERKQDLADTIEDLGEERPETHIAPFKIDDLYPDEAPPEFDVLPEEERCEFLASSAPKLRSAAATSFFGSEFSDETHAMLLKLAHDDPDAETRACCWEAFFDKASEPGLLREMVARLSNASTPPVERAGLALGLARHTDQAAVHKAVVELAESPETRERAVETMWRSFDASFAPHAVKYLDDPDMEVRRNAVWAIGYLQSTQNAGKLTELFENEDLREDALHNYALVAPGATTRKKIRELYDRIEVLAKGFTDEEAAAVEAGLDVRLVRAGLKPYFQREEVEDDEPGEVQPASAEKIGRNDPCPCGSGKKYKKCHGGS